MKNSAFLIIMLMVVGCSPSATDIIENHLKAIGKTDFIKTISTKATCKGPEGRYTTSTQSRSDTDYLFFAQDYTYKSPFYALVFSMEKAFGLDSTMTNKGPLSKPIIGVMKAHEFHELMMQPLDRFSIEDKQPDTLYFEEECRRVIAKDRLDLPVTLFFNKQTNLLVGFTQVNPYKKSELIQIHFEDWLEMDGVKVFDKVSILQGENARFSFDFEFILFNDPDFKELGTE